MKTISILSNMASQLRVLAIIGLSLLPKLAVAAGILCGQTVGNTTTSPSENDAYTYTNTAGQIVAISIYGPLGEFSPYPHMNADIYNPGGQLVATVSSGNYDTGGVLGLTLTNTGIYTIVVHANNYSSTGSYTLSLQSLTRGGCNSTPIACGQSISTNTSYNSEMDAYSFDGSAGQILAFSLYGPLNEFSPYQAMNADIYGPTGQYLATVASGNYDTGGVLGLTLTNTGVYTIVAHANNYNGAGHYTMSVQSLTGGGCDTKAISCGHSVSASTSYNTEMDAYSFDSAAGQVLAFSLYGPLNEFSPYQAMNADIYGPAGQYLATVASGNYNTGGNLDITLTNAGVYTIVVHANHYNGAGQYNMSIQSLTGGGCNSTSISCGQSISTNTSYNTEMDAYSFTAIPGEPLVISLYGPLNEFSPYQAMDADIFDPSGLYLGTVASGNYNTGGASALTLTNAGIYTIVVHCNSFNGAGAYSISIQSVTGGGCDSIPISCGHTINSKTTYRTEMDAYGFETSGGTVIFGFSGYGAARFDLYDSIGNILLIGTAGTGPTTNLAQGIYTLLVHDANYAGTGSYGITTTCIGSPCNPTIGPTGPILVGSRATNGAVAVTNGSGCSWSASANTSWLHITSATNGVGNGTVSYSVDANINRGQRSGTLTVAGYTIYIGQADPVILTGIDINNPGATGGFGYSNGTYTASGSGEGTDGTADVFYFLYTTLAGDGEIIVRVDSEQGGDPRLAEAGVMVRETLDSGSKQASLWLNESTNIIFQRRLTADDFTHQNDVRATNLPQGPNNVWLRLMRMGNTFVAHYSADGLNWQYMWFTTMNMSNTVQVGLAVTAHHNGETNTAVFDNLYLGALTSLGTWSLPGPELFNGGEGWSRAEMQRVGGFEFLLEGNVGDYFSVSGSTNVAAPFASWSLLGNVTNTYGVAPFFDTNSPSYNNRYYRAKRLGP